ncbi:amidohydrolase [Curtobacterium sp. MCBD17_028]|uniref:amidohydrolase family protein n=1 Tax=Curtobacterium sp. MCBD17_028 TaxID=2175670 RepID=UPI000DAAB8B8|nr:amidohydrolase family protein [Curtobacterium sp. MCBD17_028]PZE23564.1 hydrolase [Curtobacterium sp. MCBD17_028]
MKMQNAVTPDAQALYDGPVIDAHFHMWDLAGDHYPWLMPGGSFGPKGLFDSLKHDYVLDDYRRDIDGQNVVASVHIEALWDAEDSPVNETRWLESLDKSDNLAIRYVAAVPFERPDTEQLIREQAAFERVVSIRQTIAWNPDPENTMMVEAEISRRPSWRAALPVIAELGLALDLLIYPWQADEVVELAAAYPSLTIVVNHIASPIDQSPDGLARWRDDVALLATAANVVIKVSSVHGYLPEPTYAHAEPLIRHVLDRFGGGRSMIASDFPVGGIRGITYAEAFDQYRRAAAHLSADEQFALFCGTASRVYRIPLASVGVQP